MSSETHDIDEPSPFERLPQELVEHIISYLFPATTNQGHLLYVNWSIYSAALPYIYRSPHITSSNLLKFSDCITARQSTLGDSVQVLNLRRVIHGAKASQMSRIVRRCCRNLQEFYAPQVGFAQSAFRAIGLCNRLKVLDLNAVSEKVELSFLLAAIAKATTLESIYFPRFSKNTDGPLIISWPPRLRHVWLSGAINDDLLTKTPMPSSVDSCVLQNCPLITLPGLSLFLQHIGPQLSSFSALYPLSVPPDSLDWVLVQCPNLKTFKGYVDYFTQGLFRNIPDNHPLETLILDSAGGLLNRDNKITADDVSFAIVEGRLTNLRQVRWSLQVGWRSEKSDVRDLSDLLAYAGEE